jgi:hypothetical protein
MRTEHNYVQSVRFLSPDPEKVPLPDFDEDESNLFFDTKTNSTEEQSNKLNNATFKLKNLLKINSDEKLSNKTDDATSKLKILLNINPIEERPNKINNETLKLKSLLNISNCFRVNKIYLLTNFVLQIKVSI